MSIPDKYLVSYCMDTNNLSEAWAPDKSIHVSEKSRKYMNKKRTYQKCGLLFSDSKQKSVPLTNESPPYTPHLRRILAFEHE